MLFAASIPPPAGGGSVEYLHHIMSHLPADRVVVHTGNLYPEEAAKFDRTFPCLVIRSRFIFHVLEGYYVGEDRWRILGRKVARLREYIQWPLTAMWLILRERPDVVYIGEQNFAALAAWVAQKLFGIPYVYFTYAEEITTLDKRAWLKAAHLRLLRGAALVVTVSEYTRGLLLKAGVRPECIAKVIPPVGPEKRLAMTGADLAATRETWGLAGHHRVLLTVGSLAARKGHATVLDALPLVNARGSDVRYVVVGGGPLEGELKQRARDLGVAGQVVFTGRIGNVELGCLYEIADVFVMPHRQLSDTLDTEGCPTVFLEASAHGKPVIGGNAGGVADAILDGVTGYTIDGTDATALANTICRLLADADLSRTLGEAGRAYVASLTPEQSAAQVRQATLGLLVRRGRASERTAVT